MKISNVAIIKVIPTDLEMGACCPGEIGLSYADGSVISWIIRPERLWRWRQAQINVGQIGDGVRPSSNVSLEAAYLLTHGKPPQQVVEELTQAVHGYEVYADAPHSASKWLDVLYNDCGVRPQFEIGALSVLIREIELSSVTGFPIQEVIDETYASSPPFGHAAADVARSADIVARICKRLHS